MSNMRALTNLLENIELVSGVKLNAQEVISDAGCIERAVKTMVGTYCQCCRIEGEEIKMISGAEDLITEDIGWYREASKWD